jgi:hypothetical protein
LIEFYRRHREALQATPYDDRFMPYPEEWTRLPNPLHPVWLPYSFMLDEFAREIANAINDLTNHVHRLRAWAAVAASLSYQEKMNACHEFIGGLATLAVNLPYVIRSRFIFAAVHLSHQANMVFDRPAWVDDLLMDDEIYIDQADARGKRWKTYRILKRSIEGMAGKAFCAATHDFRNSYNHRFSPRFVVGITRFVRRQKDPVTGRITYNLGGLEPLQLDHLADILAGERDQAYRAFEAFQALVHEQSDAIAGLGPVLNREI